MHKTYHFTIFNGEYSDGYATIEDCIKNCKKLCNVIGVDYNSSDVRLFFTDDFGETYEECTKKRALIRLIVRPVNFTGLI